VTTPLAEDLLTVAEDSARGGFFLFSGTASATVILGITSILIGRFLGPELYGQYTLTLVVPQLLLVFTNLGIEQGIIKFTASLRVRGEINRLTKIIKYSLLLKALTGVTIFIINYAFADLFASAFLQRPDLAFYIRLASIGLVFQVIFSTIMSAFVGLDKTQYNALTSNVQAMAKAIISISLILVGFSVVGALWGHVASHVVAAGAGVSILFLALNQEQNAESNYNFKEALTTLMRYGAPLYLSILLTSFIPLYKNILLAIFTTDANIGNYKAATNFETLIAIITVPIATMLLPAFSKLESSANHKITTFFKLANKYTALLILPITFLIIIFSHEIVNLIYGSTYESAPLFLATISVSYFLVGIGSFTLLSFYNGLGETRTTLKINLIFFILLVTLSPILTQNYSVIGLIIASLIASTTSDSYGLYIARTKHKIELDTRALVKIYLISILSSLPPIVLLQLSPMPSLLNVTAGALLYLFTYVTLTPLAKIVSHSELQTAFYIFQRIKPLALVTTPLLKYQEKILSYHS